MKLDKIIKSDNREVLNLIISKLQDLINFKNLEPGDKLPSERMLAEKFDVSRKNIREAIQKLEFHGLLKSIPQSGTFIANIGVIALNGIIDDILRLEEGDFKSLVETRILLELKAVGFAALRRTDEQLLKIEEALKSFEEKVSNGEDAVQEDLLFHLAIASASGNSVLNSLMLYITPGIITNFKKYHICDYTVALTGIKEHKDIFEAIKNQDSKEAKEKLKIHFRGLFQYCSNNNSSNQI